MSEMDAAAAAACVPALPEDVVSEILARVSDVVSLFRCSAVCKPWRRVVADPAFLRRYGNWPAGGASSLLGFFVQRHQLSVNARRKVSKLFPSRAPVLAPPPRSALGPGRRFLSSFVRNDAGVLDQAKPLAARNSLLLVRLVPRRGDKCTVDACACVTCSPGNATSSGRWMSLTSPRGTSTHTVRATAVQQAARRSAGLAAGRSGALEPL